MIRLSIIIPAYKETAIIDDQIRSIFDRAKDPQHIEIIICDVNNTTQVSDKRAFYVNCKNKGRAVQLNYGAAHAQGEYLYFIHADSVPPFYFDRTIVKVISQKKLAGCFRLKFDHDHHLLNISSWFTRFKSNWCRGGDQSLFITRDLFNQLGGFNESLGIMEDIEMVKRIKKYGEFHVINQYVTTSARKYLANGVYRLQILFGLLHMKYRLGFSQSSMQRFYKKYISTP